MPALDTLVERLEHYHYRQQPPRGEADAADLDNIAAGFLLCGLSESDTSVRKCRTRSADARRHGR